MELPPYCSLGCLLLSLPVQKSFSCTLKHILFPQPNLPWHSHVLAKGSVMATVLKLWVKTPSRAAVSFQWSPEIFSIIHGKYRNPAPTNKLEMFIVPTSESATCLVIMSIFSWSRVCVDYDKKQQTLHGNSRGRELWVALSSRNWSFVESKMHDTQRLACPIDNCAHLRMK